jgi:hypothetical protein
VNFQLASALSCTTILGLLLLIHPAIAALNVYVETVGNVCCGTELQQRQGFQPYEKF